MIAEARRLGHLCEVANVTSRLLGGVGVALHAHGDVPAPLQRAYADLDYLVKRTDSPAWRRLLETHGYVGDVEFNSLHGSRRLLHYDSTNRRQIDSFVDVFEMCHTLEPALPVAGYTLTPTDLLLTKLQIVQVNDKDLLDVLLLLIHHPVDEGEEAVSIKRLQQVAGGDWGWYTTLHDNVEKLALRLDSVSLEKGQRELLATRISQVSAALNAAPRSFRWRARAVVGRKAPWYVLPEEPGER